MAVTSEPVSPRIRVEVETSYIEEQSDPRDKRYVFSYTITIRNEGQVPARLSVWKDPTANKDNDIFSRVADWIGKGTSKGPFPIPDNLRYTELETAFENLGYPIFYGEVGLDEGMKKVQDECQRIMDQPRG